MKTRSTRRARRRSASQEQKKDQKFFGPAASETFFQPNAVHRAPEPAGEEKKDDKVSRAPDEKKEEKDVKRAPEEKKEEKKEEKEVKRAPEAAAEGKEEKKEEKKVSKKADPAAMTEAGESTSRYVDDIEGKGQSLGSKEREFFGDRMGFDFSEVRIHTGEEAAESARDAGAKAYTYGNHVVFSEGRYNPESHEGRKLLAHELAHVTQQNPVPKSGKEAGSAGGGGGAHSHEPPQSSQAAKAPAAVHRQLGDGTGTTVAAPTATPAADPALFQSRLRIALAQMRTPTVANETLSGTLEPVLRDMADNAEWVNATGVSSGGADVSVRLRTGGRMVNLRLILDDSPNPTLQGGFNAAGADRGVIRIHTRLATDSDVLATTLYHECLHLMRWLSKNAPGGDLVAETGATGGRRMTLEGIDPARQPQHVAQVRRRISDLASSVNAARPTTDRVDGAGIDRLTNFMMEEYLVRIETEVFRLMRDSDAISRSRRPGVGEVRIMTSTDQLFPLVDVNRYLFEIGSVFREADRTRLDGFDRQRINDLFEYFRDRVSMFVRRRYSDIIHGPDFP